MDSDCSDPICLQGYETGEIGNRALGIGYSPCLSTPYFSISYLVELFLLLSGLGKGVVLLTFLSAIKMS